MSLMDFIRDHVVINTDGAIRRKSTDSPEVQEFVRKLAMEANRFFDRYVPPTDYGFIKLDVRNVLPEEAIWKWVNVSTDRSVWLYAAIRDVFEFNRFPLTIDDGGIIRHKDEPRLS